MIKKFKLRNDIEVIVEKLEHVKSVSVGYWVRVGSMNETEKNNGVSHFIEHMLFKGTEHLTAKEIATTMDNIGGQLNAFTSKECTCYYAKVMDTHVDIAFNVLSDMIQNPLFEERDIERERGVVIEEINMYEDSPEDLAHDELAKVMYQNNPLGYPILGTIETLTAMDRECIVSYYNQYYTPQNLVISVVGNVDYDQVIEMLNDRLGDWGAKHGEFNQKVTEELTTGVVKRTKDIEQFHMCLGFKGYGRNDQRQYSLLVLNNILGGSMSSRLFQKIREEMGLVYSIYSYPTNYFDTGVFTIYAGMNSNEVETVMTLIKDELELLKTESVSDEEFLTAKEQLKGNYILGLESTSSRMINYGRSYLLEGSIKTQEEILEKIDKISKKDIENIIEDIFSNPVSISYVSDYEETDEIHNRIIEKLR